MEVKKHWSNEEVFYCSQSAYYIPVMPINYLIYSLQFASLNYQQPHFADD